ncbi:MAG: helix-turn-helix transcriptional regulator [Clostridia bacterium]|nr:helix-turn-helix transcriptional regulator [Clostridia bacterium]
MSHRIKELIREKGYTQQQFADKLGLTRERLNAIVNGKPSYPNLERLAEALGVEMWELFTTREEILAKSPGEITCPYCEKSFSLKS